MSELVCCASAGWETHQFSVVHVGGPKGHTEVSARSGVKACVQTLVLMVMELLPDR